MAETHRHWRLAFYVNPANPTIQEIREAEFHATVGGADQATGGTASGSAGTTHAASLAFDDSVANNSSTHWRATQSAYAQAWLAYDFGAPVAVLEWSFALNSANFKPAVHGLQYSDDGAAWTELHNVYYPSASWAAAGSFNTFSVTDPPGTAVSATTAALLAIPGTAVGQAVSNACAFVVQGAVTVRKALGYSVLSSSGNDDAVGVRKAVGYAVLDSGTTVNLRKALGYAVLADAATARRRPLILSAG